MMCTCGECTRCLNREAARRYRERHPDRVKAAHRRHSGTDKRRAALRRASKTEKGRAARKRQQAQPEEKRRNAVRQRARRALRAGKIERQGCEVCGEHAEMHHDDYDRPFDVRWLCKAHHEEVHHH